MIVVFGGYGTFGSLAARGFVTAYEALGAQGLVDRLAGAGYRLAW